MKRIIEQTAEASLAQSVADLVAEGGNVLATDDSTAGTVDEAIDNGTAAKRRRTLNKDSVAPRSDANASASRPEREEKRRTP
jgi:hypothetical protein